MADTMSDRELLELAAKAAGIEIKATCDGTCCIDVGEREPVYWNPLTDDGDALRLAVKLGVDVKKAVETHYFFDDHVDYNKDPYAATRRAIVRAAAEIGRRNG